MLLYHNEFEGVHPGVYQHIILEEYWVVLTGVEILTHSDDPYDYVNILKTEHGVIRVVDRKPIRVLYRTLFSSVIQSMNWGEFSKYYFENE